MSVIYDAFMLMPVFIYKIFIAYLVIFISRINGRLQWVVELLRSKVRKKQDITDKRSSE